MNTILKIIGFSALLLAGCSRIENTSKPKIIGGNVAPAYPFMVGLVKPEAGGDFIDRASCGGTLVKKRVVVTAAHCVDSMNKGTYVILGSTKARVPADRGVKIQAIALHPDWKGAESANMHNDIALLFLDDYDASSFEHPVAPIDVDRTFLSLGMNGLDAKVIGWGNTSSFGELLRDELREVNVPIIEESVCKTTYPDLTYTQICAGVLQLGGADSCQGDSGGPLVTNMTGEFTLIGVVSYGNGCAQKNKPGVYTKTATFLEWIDQTIAAHTDLAAVTGKALTTLVKSHCLDPFQSTSESAEGFSTIKNSMDFKIGSVFLPENMSGALPAGSVIATCNFSVPVAGQLMPVAVELVGTEKSGRFVATIDGKKFHAGAATTASMELACAATGSSDPMLTLKYNQTSGMNLLTWSGTDYFLGMDWNSDLDDFQESASCAIGTTLTRLFTKDTTFVALISGPNIPGGMTIKEAYKAGNSDSESIQLFITTADGKTGKAVMLNSSSDDIFTWQLSCNVAVTLTDKYGVSYAPEAKDGNHLHDFIYPAHAAGGWAQNASIDFSIESSDVIDSALQCKVNGQSVSIVIGDGIPQAPDDDGDANNGDGNANGQVGGNGDGQS